MPSVEKRERACEANIPGFYQHLQTAHLSKTKLKTLEKPRVCADMKEPEKVARSFGLRASQSRPDQEAPQPGDSQLGLWTLQDQFSSVQSLSRVRLFATP